MKLVLLYKDYFYCGDKIINNISNQILQIVYFDSDHLKNLETLYKKNNLILKIINANELNLKDGDYSLDMHAIQINNGKVTNIDTNLHHHNPIHRSIHVKNTEINLRIVYHNILYYNKYILIIFIILFALSYYIFNMQVNIDINARNEILKTFA